MNPFDEDYLARREKQIQDLYILRGNTLACLITGLLLALISIVATSSGSKISYVLFGISLLFVAASIFMTSTYFAQKAADRVIQRERDQLLALYGQKPKRGSQENLLRLADDGELAEENNSAVMSDHSR